jgi:hypothetical protein
LKTIILGLTVALLDCGAEYLPPELGSLDAGLAEDAGTQDAGQCDMAACVSCFNEAFDAAATAESACDLVCFNEYPYPTGDPRLCVSACFNARRATAKEQCLEVCCS